MKPIVLLATLGDAMYPLCLVFVGTNGLWSLLLIHFYGLFNTPITIGADNLVLKLSPDRNNSSYIAVFKAVVGLAAMLAAILGGWLAQSPLLGPTAGTAAMLSGLKVVFLISFLGRIASLFLLAGVAEPGAQPVSDIVFAWPRAWNSPRTVPQWLYDAGPIANGMHLKQHATDATATSQFGAVS
jgi:fucose permease